MSRPDLCPDCGRSVTSHTGSYCHHCGHNLLPRRPAPRPAGYSPARCADCGVYAHREHSHRDGPYVINHWPDCPQAKS